MAFQFRSVDNNSDHLHNTQSFEERAKEIAEESGVRILAPNEAILNTETGEVTSYSDVVKTEETFKKEIRTKYYLKKKRESTYTDYGAFFWLVYNPVKKLFPELNSTDVVMLIVLATYINYNGNVVLPNGYEVLRKDLVRLLDSTDATVSRFVKHTTDARLLTVRKDGTLKINSTVMYKGNIDVTRGRCARIYVNICQNLYYNSDSMQRKRLYYIFSMLPWIHFERNILCHNPDEKDLSNVVPMTVFEYARYIGYSRKNIKRLLDIILSFTLEDGEPLVLLITSYDVSKGFMIVNPKLMCGAKNADIMRLVFSWQKQDTKKCVCLDTEQTIEDHSKRCN